MSNPTTEYNTQAIDPAVLSVLDVELDGKVVSAQDWKTLWQLVFNRINHIDAFCLKVEDLRVSLEQSRQEMFDAAHRINVKYAALEKSFVHYGTEAPTNEHVKFWVQPVTDVNPNLLVTYPVLQKELSHYVDNAIDTLEDDVAYLSTHAATKQYVVDSIAAGKDGLQEYVDSHLEGISDLVSDNQDDIKNLGERTVAVETSLETLKRTYVDTQRFEETSQRLEERITYAESDIINLQEDIVIVKEDYVTKKYVDDAVASSGGVSQEYVDSAIAGITDWTTSADEDISSLLQRTETLETKTKYLPELAIGLQNSEQHIERLTSEVEELQEEVKTIGEEFATVEDLQGAISSNNEVLKEYVDDAIASSGGTGGGSSDDVIDKIIDPDNNPLNEAESTLVPIELGGLNAETGELVERDDAIRTVDFVPAVVGSSVYFTSEYPIEDAGRLYVLLYDKDKAFIKTIRANKDEVFVVEDGCNYIKFYRSNITDPSIEVFFEVVPEKAEFKKIYFAEHGYELYGDIIDDETMHKLVVYASGKDENTFNIIEVKAPSHNPEEATICLMNWGNDAKQFVDFSSMVYNPENPTAEIVCQTRGGKKLPEFSIRYNDGQGAGRVKKFTVHPDAIPIELTAQGLKVRKNNTFDNNGAEEDYVVVNLAQAVETINYIVGNYATKAYVDGNYVSTTMLEQMVGIFAENYATKQYVENYINEALGGEY